MAKNAKGPTSGLSSLLSGTDAITASSGTSRRAGKITPQEPVIAGSAVELMGAAAAGGGGGRGLGGGTGIAGSIGSPVTAAAPPFTTGNDDYTGTIGNDVVSALDGTDTLLGADGNDTLYGDSARDSIYGDTGADFLYGEHGDDYIDGGFGNDTINDESAPVRDITGDIQVNVDNSLGDFRPFVANLTDGGGGFIVGWQQGANNLPAESATEVFTQRFDSSGGKVGLANAFDTIAAHGGDAKGEISITALKGPLAGQYIVTWYSFLEPAEQTTTYRHEAFMARFDANGNRLGNITTIDQASGAYTTSHPSVVALDNGTWVTIWQDQARETNGGALGWGVYAKHYRAAGDFIQAVTNSDTHINQSTEGNQGIPRSALLSNGNIVVTWTDDNLEGVGNSGFYFRIIDPTDVFPPASEPVVLGNQQRINFTTVGTQSSIGNNVVALAGGGFVVVWNGNGTDVSSGLVDGQGTFFQIYNNAGQRLNANGVVELNSGISTERTAHAPNTNNQYNATVTALQDGGFFVVWNQNNATGDAAGEGLMGQRFDALGNRVGDPIRINQNTAGDQEVANVTTLADGTVVVTWVGQGITTGNDDDVFVRLFRFGTEGGNDTFFGNNGADVLLGVGGNDRLYGGAAIDTVDGGLGNDYVAGDAAADVLRGDAGNDTVEGGVGADSMDGGSGSDWAYYHLSSAAVSVNLSGAGTELGGDAQGDFVTRIEHVMGSSFNDYLEGMGGATNTNAPGDVDSRDNSLVGLAGMDTLRGNAGLDNLYGGDDNDLLIGGLHADFVDGGAGNDTASYDNSSAAVNVDMSDGNPESGGDAQGDVLTNVENLIGSSHHDYLRGQGVAGFVNTFLGGEGDDTLDGAQGADTLRGDSGQDWAWYNFSGNGVTVNLDDAAPEVGGQAQGDVLVSIEHVAGSNLNDVLTGDGLANSLRGNDGNDLLATGGNGDGDHLDGSTGNDTVTYAVYTEGVTVNLTTGVGNLTATPSIDHTLVAIENVVGTDFVDKITGDAGVNTLASGLGDDTLAGLAGADSLLGGAGQDIAEYVASALGISVNLADSLTETGGDAQGDFLTGVEHIYGSGLADSLVGDTNANMLFGRGGADILDGGAGIDSLVAAGGNDVLYWDTFDSVVSGGSGLDTMVGTGARDEINLSHAKFTANPFEANPDSHSIEVWHLGGGDDWFAAATAGIAYTTMDRNGHVIFGGDGNDQMYFKYNFSNPTQNSNDTAFGGTGFDWLYGSYGNDTLFGGEGTLVGDNSGDVLYGGKGNDTLVGGSGYDSYYFGRAEGQDRIYDYAFPDRMTTNGLWLFAGSTSNHYGVGGNSFDGVDPTEVTIFYGATDVTVSIDQNDVFDPNNFIVFDKGAISRIFGEDYVGGDAGNTSLGIPGAPHPLPPHNPIPKAGWFVDWNTLTQQFNGFPPPV